MHTPLVLGENGEKLSKQNGALGLDVSNPLAALNGAAGVLGLEACESLVEDALNRWTQQWLTSRSQL
jgi:glutamyl-Q tRNA(Asp) synthetase